MSPRPMALYLYSGFFYNNSKKKDGNPSTIIACFTQNKFMYYADVFLLK